MCSPDTDTGSRDHEHSHARRVAPVRGNKCNRTHRSASSRLRSSQRRRAAHARARARPSCMQVLNTGSRDVPQRYKRDTCIDICTSAPTRPRPRAQSSLIRAQLPGARLAARGPAGVVFCSHSCYVRDTGTVSAEVAAAGLLPPRWLPLHACISCMWTCVAIQWCGRCTSGLPQILATSTS